MKKTIALASAAALAATGFAGAAVAAPSAMPMSTVTITASPNGLKYVKSQLKAKAGMIKVVFVNPSPLQHNVKLEIGEKEYGGTKTIAKGQTSITVNLKAGKYHFYCSVPGHEAAGMQGYLTVS